MGTLGPKRGQRPSGVVGAIALTIPSLPWPTPQASYYPFGDMRNNSTGDEMPRIEADCLALLVHVAEHRGEPQTYKSLSEATGIPITTLRRLIRWPAIDGIASECSPGSGLCRQPAHATHWALRVYGAKYGFGVCFLRNRGRILDVERYGYIQSSGGRLLIEENASKYPWTKAMLDE